jgi:type II secretory ATPase GspE/PulE/Tfp pilus assembly ATPase PilB-like protein
LASEIKLKDGTVYYNTKILNREAGHIQIAVPQGTLEMPISEIESIDGVAPSPPHPAAASPNPASDLPTQASPPPYVHQWRMDFFLLGFAVLSAAWISALLWVQKDAEGSPAQVKRANAEVLLLPGIGFLLYVLARSRRVHRKEDLRVQAQEALAPTKAGPKRRFGLFGARSRGGATASKALGAFEFLDAERNPIKIKKDLPGMTGIESARKVLEQAIAERASDVHIEPRENTCQVRLRIDGVLQERMAFEKTDGIRVVAALKTLAEIDIAEKRKAQDGRFRVRTGLGEVDFRVATASSIHGEKMVLRILDAKSGLLSLSDLGMSKEMMEEFNRVIHSRSGIILATGPTGSGKTSTLYAALNRMDTKRLNIMTIEDPVEYELTGATQIPVNPKAGVTYESGLRSIMRQDPDVIFVGEMRDAEAAKIAMRAALTGHLVLSSLHTKDAISTIVRLEEMGVEKYQISSALLMLVAQRLVRVLCTDCREPYKAAETELNELGMPFEADRLIYRARGCESCDNTGYKGRTGIFELLVMNDSLRRAIDEGASEQAILELASKKGFRNYREEGVQKILSGITTVEEVLQAS